MQRRCMAVYWAPFLGQAPGQGSLRAWGSWLRVVLTRMPCFSTLSRAAHQVSGAQWSPCNDPQPLRFLLVPRHTNLYLGNAKSHSIKKITSYIVNFKQFTVIFFFFLHLKSNKGASLAVQWLRLCTSTAGGTGSNPGQRTKISHSARCGQK